MIYLLVGYLVELLSCKKNIYISMSVLFHVKANVVRLNHSCHSTLLVNVHMPCDNHYKNNVNIEFSNAIDEIECIIYVGSSTRLILCGDWNCDLYEIQHKVIIC